MDQYGTQYMKLVFALITATLIIAIVLINILFLWRQRPYTHEFFQVRYCVKIGIAITNIVIAVFSMTLDVLRQLDESLNCKLFRIALSYQLHYCPLVFGLAFTLLSLELILRFSYQSFPQLKWNKSLNINLASSLSPWLAGLLIATPLSLSNVDWEDGCYYETLTHTRITLLICMVAPVTIALISSCFIFCFLPVNAKSQKVKFLPKDSCAQDFDTFRPEENVPIDANPKFFQNDACASVTPHPNQSQLQRKESVSSNDVNGANLCARRNEGRMLLLSSVILFVSVTPLPFFSLGYVFNYYDAHKIERDTDNIISNVLYAFFLCTHSLFVPLVWLSFSRP